MKRVFDLEDRFINYACGMIEIVELLPNTRAGNYIAGQLIRSCNSPAFNYAEVQAAESKNDFIHKLKIVLKELKECRVTLKIILKRGLVASIEKVHSLSKETEELIAIIAASIETTKRNQRQTSQQT